MVMVSCLKQGSEMCNFRRVVLTRTGVSAYTPLCTRVPRMSKFNKKQKQNRETKKKSKRYIRVSRVNTGVAMDWFLKISVLQARFYWLGDVEEMICPWKENVDGRKII